MENKSKMTVIPVAALAALATAGSVQSAWAKDAKQPNVIVIYIDDMGYSDISGYGGMFVPTPNMDRLGSEGIKFNQYYTSCPISSPSRVGVTTGMYPTQWGITTFLNDRKANRNNQSNDYLLTEAPTIAKAMKAGGYATGHFGKWHMGGGRDVSDAPKITAYGFDEYSSTWESPDPDPKLTAENWIWSDKDEIKRWERTAYFVDKTLDFLRRNPDQPCFINLWPDDMHTPYVPSQEIYDKTNTNSSWSNEINFKPVLEELDVQIGRLLDGLQELGIDENTVIFFTSDNGPNPSYKNARTLGMRGQKGTLYEGGIRMPFMVRWPGTIAPGQVNDETIMASVDLFPTICAIAGIKKPETNGYTLDGIDFSKALMGKQNVKRSKPMFWEFGRNMVGQNAGNNSYHTRSPNIGMRDGDWKLLVNYDGTSVELYNIAEDVKETTNVADQNPQVAAKMKKQAIDWFNSSFRKYAGELK